MTTLKKILLISLSPLATVAFATPMPEGGWIHASIGGQHINLIEDNGRCVLSSAEGVSLPLDMKWPCRFSINKQKQVRIETFDDISILMVEHTERVPNDSHRDCNTDLRAVRWAHGRFESTRPQHISNCGLGVWDQKMFVAGFRW